MCRVYKAQAGWYVRLCYYHGDRKGERVPVPEGYELETTHYHKRRLLRQPGAKQTAKAKQVKRCIYCNLCMSRHNTTGVCTFCTEHPERRPRGK